MKILKRITCLVLMVFMISAFVLTGCASGLKDNPKASATSYSNGGMAVVKGEYLYYVNGYVNEDDLTDAKTENVEGEVVRGAIYRTKLVDGTIVKDKDGFVKDEKGRSKTECVVSKIVGFSNGGFYIIKDHIYYATPCMNYSSKAEDSDSALQKDLVEFHSIKLDGTDDKLIYTTTEASDDLKWNVTTLDDKVYITSYTGKTLMVANATDRETLATVEDVTSCAMPNNSEYGRDYDDGKLTNRYIYYTRDVVEDDNQSANYKGNVVCSLRVRTGDTDVVKFSNDNNTKYSFILAKDNAVYYTKSNVILGDHKLLYKNNLENNPNFADETKEFKLTNTGCSSFVVVDTADATNCVLGLDSTGKIYRFTSYEATNSVESVELLYTATTNTKFVGQVGNTVYLADSNKVNAIDARADLSSGQAEATLVTLDTYTYLITNSHFFDVTSRFIFAYGQFTKEDDTFYYLTFADVENGYEVRFVGEFSDEDLPKEPEQAEGYDPEDPDCTVEYTPWID